MAGDGKLTMTIHVEPVDAPTFGVWCDCCNLPSAFTVPMVMYPPMRLWLFTGCGDCGCRTLEPMPNA